MSKLKFLGLLILLLAIPASLYLARHPQILKGRATGPEMQLRSQTGGILPLVNNIAQTNTQQIQLHLTYALGTAPTPTPISTPTSGSDQCSFNLTEGQILREDAVVILTGQRPDPFYYLSLQIINSRYGSFQVLSSQANVLFVNLSTPGVFQNGPATIECRIQTDPEGGTIIYSKQVSINVQN